MPVQLMCFTSVAPADDYSPFNVIRYMINLQLRDAHDLNVQVIIGTENVEFQKAITAF